MLDLAYVSRSHAELQPSPSSLNWIDNAKNVHYDEEFVLTVVVVRDASWERCTPPRCTVYGELSSALDLPLAPQLVPRPATEPDGQRGFFIAAGMESAVTVRRRLQISAFRT